MVEISNVMFEVGVIMLVSFIGAALASKAKQSVILGYILAGILIGPYMYLKIGDFTYAGMVKDTAFISYLSTMGLTLLMFFVGLGFSITKLKKTKTPAMLLALINVGLNMFTGILLGFALGWPVIDTVFLAGVIAMSSAAITGKSLMEQGRMNAPETEFLLGMVIVENFLSMILLTIAGGLMFKTSIGGDFTLTRLIVGILAFYTFFIFLAIFVIPRVVKYFQKIKSDEMFVLFALGLVFLSAALAEVSGVPSIIGAFFLGMVFSETKLAERFEDRISPFRDALVAVFFVSFGMLIDPAMLPQIITIALIAAPLVVLNDLLLTGALAYLLGFTAKGSAFIGASICGRGAESVMFASVGTNSPAVVKGAELNPFAGTFCFIMSMITPALMKISARLTVVLSKHIPRFLKHGGAIINRTLGKIILPTSLKLYQRTRRLEIALCLYFAILVAVMITSGLVQAVIFGMGVIVTIVFYHLTEAELYPIVKIVNYDNLGVVVRDAKVISSYIAYVIFASLMMIMFLAFFFGLMWQTSLIIFLGYTIVVMVITHRAYRMTRTPSVNIALAEARRKIKPRKTTGGGKGKPVPKPVQFSLPPIEDDIVWEPKPSPKTNVSESVPPRFDPEEESKWRRL